MLLFGQYSVAFLLKAWYGEETFELSWHLLLTQLVNVYFVILAALGLESFTVLDGKPKFVYIALSHSVSSIVVTGAMVATIIFSYAYSSSTSGHRALLWSWTGYAATASHLVFVALHNNHDIPIDFYLQTTGAHAPPSRMIGFGVSWYKEFELVLLGVCVALFVLRSRSVSWLLFGALVWTLSLLRLNVVAFATPSSWLAASLLVCIGVPLAARYIEKTK